MDAPTFGSVDAFITGAAMWNGSLWTTSAAAMVHPPSPQIRRYRPWRRHVAVTVHGKL
jgi:hypothetical protein